MVHAAIPVVLLIHGMAFSALIAGRRPLPASHDALVVLVVAGFVMSLLFNVLVAGALSLLDIPIQYTLSAVFIADAALIGAWLKYRSRTVNVQGAGYGIWIVVVACFVVMIANGGLVSILADSWWHMIYANRMSEAGSILLERHHLTGGPGSAYDFAYEPGWHINLVLISALADAPLPLVWHALGAWCAALGVLAYYHLARVLTESTGIALLSAVLFAVTLGGINSYFRASPWPGNAGFIVLYLLLASTFTCLGHARESRSRIIDALFPVRFLYDMAKGAPHFTALCVACVLLIAGLHLAEGLWFVAALAFYSFALSCTGSDVGAAEKDRQVLRFVWIWFFGLWALAVVMKDSLRIWDVGFVLLVLVLTRLLVLGWRHVGSLGYARILKSVVVLGGAVMAWLFLDLEHLWRLFRPGEQSTGSDLVYIPMYLHGYFDTWVGLPRWEHQLRAGLLFSGVAGILGAAWLLVAWRNRAGLFLFATAAATLTILISPYLFTFFASLVKATGVYRFQVLLFHPIILACCFWLLMHRIFRLPRQRDELRNFE